VVVEVEVVGVEVLAVGNVETTSPRIKMRAVTTMPVEEVVLEAEQAKVVVVVEAVVVVRAPLLMMLPNKRPLLEGLARSGVLHAFFPVVIFFFTFYVSVVGR
jgi:hypothetical protein